MLIISTRSNGPFMSITLLGSRDKAYCIFRWEKIGTYLYSRLRQIYFESNLFPGVNVWIMRLLKGPFQFFELSRGESRPDASLFPLLRQNSVVMSRVNLVGQSSCRKVTGSFQIFILLNFWLTSSIRNKLFQNHALKGHATLLFSDNFVVRRKLWVKDCDADVKLDAPFYGNRLLTRMMSLS